jgi:hypothetical protein
LAGHGQRHDHNHCCKSGAPLAFGYHHCPRNDARGGWQQALRTPSQYPKPARQTANTSPAWPATLIDRLLPSFSKIERSALGFTGCRPVRALQTERRRLAIHTRIVICYCKFRQVEIAQWFAVRITFEALSPQRRR